MVDIAQMALMVMRLTLFGLSLGLTVVSFQAYRRRQTKRLETAFIGFAFISMGVGLTTLVTQQMPSLVLAQETTGLTVLQIAETIPFIIGFSMLYASLYR